jgi:catechol 2,3-dioxygenase-like lactoylglutathione lyase family enzyme
VKLNVITLAVQDLERALAFYRDGLGFATKGIVAADVQDPVSGAHGAIALFELEGGLLLAIYPRADMAKDAKVLDPGPNSVEFSLGHLVGSRAEVDALLRAAEKAGARITEPPRERPWGIYSGYFSDPDGHLWEIIWNPAMPNARAFI